jgi:hypothetical protein
MNDFDRLSESRFKSLVIDEMDVRFHAVGRFLFPALAADSDSARLWRDSSSEVTLEVRRGRIV